MVMMSHVINPVQAHVADTVQSLHTAVYGALASNRAFSATPANLSQIMQHVATVASAFANNPAGDSFVRMTAFSVAVTAHRYAERILAGPVQAASGLFHEAQTYIGQVFELAYGRPASFH